MIDEDKPQLDLEKNIYKYSYQIIYWTIFILTWVVVPMIQEYINSNKLTRFEKFCHALKTNFLFYLVLLIIGIAILIYLISTKKFNM